MTEQNQVISAVPMRVGLGYDVHAFAPDRKLILGGVEIPHHQGLLGHSDADVLAHAVADALLGALTGEPMKRDVEKAKEHLSKCKYKPEEMKVDLTWIGEVPLEERFALLMQANFAEIGIKAASDPWPFIRQ